MRYRYYVWVVRLWCLAHFLIISHVFIVLQFCSLLLLENTPCGHAPPPRAPDEAGPTAPQKNVNGRERNAKELLTVSLATGTISHPQP